MASYVDLGYDGNSSSTLNPSGVSFLSPSRDAVFQSRQGVHYSPIGSPPNIDEVGFLNRKLSKTNAHNNKIKPYDLFCSGTLEVMNLFSKQNEHSQKDDWAILDNFYLSLSPEANKKNTSHVANRFSGQISPPLAHKKEVYRGRSDGVTNSVYELQRSRSPSPGAFFPGLTPSSSDSASSSPSLSPRYVTTPKSQRQSGHKPTPSQQITNNWNNKQVQKIVPPNEPQHVDPNNALLYNSFNQNGILSQSAPDSGRHTRIPSYDYNASYSRNTRYPSPNDARARPTNTRAAPDSRAVPEEPKFRSGRIRPSFSSPSPPSSPNLSPSNPRHINSTKFSPSTSPTNSYNHSQYRYRHKAKANRHRRSTNNKKDDPLRFEIYLEKAAAGEDARTTLMIKNIPNKYDQEMLLETINKNFKGSYDFFYLPIDFKNKCNVGYAFINFIDCTTVAAFYAEFNSKKWEKFNSEKVCEITYARIQGKNSFIDHFRNSSLMYEDPSCRPLIFHSNGPRIGTLEPFPPANVSPARTRYSSSPTYGED